MILKKMPLEKVAVRTGKVSMSVVENHQSEILTPSKMGVWHETQKQIEVSTFDPKSELAWKDNILYFSKEDMPSVLSKIETWYGVKIIVDPALKLKGDTVVSFMTNLSKMF
jgi:ferric-dicitrate binding protein FerR (iron transport regulator)